MGLKNTRFGGTYSSVGADGNIRVAVSQETPNAVRRDYELTDGTKGTKYELIYSEISGLITDIQFNDGIYGKTLGVTFNDSGEEIILNFSMASNFAEDFLKKLPNVDLNKEVTVKPYSFTDKKTGKPKKGCTVMQGEVKIDNFFTDYDEVNKKFTIKNGFPPVEEGKVYDKDDWKMYFMTTRKFLQKYTEENVIPNIIEFNVEEAVTAEEAGLEAGLEAAVESAVESAVEPSSEGSTEGDIEVKKVPFN